MVFPVFSAESVYIPSVCLSHLVAERIPDILEHFQTLLQLSSARRSALEDRLRLFTFEREAKELQTWLTSKKTVVESRDCGQDLEDVEVRHYDVRCPVIMKCSYWLGDVMTFILLLTCSPSTCRSCRRGWRSWCQRCPVSVGAGSHQCSSWGGGCSRTSRSARGTMVLGGCGRSSRAASGPENRYVIGYNSQGGGGREGNSLPPVFRVCSQPERFISSITMWTN